jgi:thiamine biosynthesis protein ThiI
MTPNAIVARFSEVFLKGGRRAHFTGLLRDALQRQVEAAGPFRVREPYGMLLVVHRDADGLSLPDLEVTGALRAGLNRCFGLVHWSPVRVVPREISRLEDEVARIAEADVAGAASFKVSASRSDKEYPIDSVELNRRLGSVVFERTKVPVKLKDPAVTLSVHVAERFAFLHTATEKGPGGLPVGSAGRVTLLLSGGIDSPVAGYLAMRRGCLLDAVHFEAAPYTSEASRAKVETLAGMLAAYEPGLRLHVVPFGAIQADLRDGAPGRLLVVLYRRMMVRIATALARADGSLALVTGENLGQVASQTLENLGVIEEAAGLPVLRPLLTFDKQETIALARLIGTFDTSILPHDDCCSLFVPPHPETAATLDPILRIERRFPVEQMVADAVAATGTREFISG